MPYKDPEKRKACYEKWAKENKKKKAEYYKEWAKENKKKKAEYYKEWAKKNKKKKAEYYKEWAKKNKESRSEYNKKYYEDNKERLLENSRKWKEENGGSKKTTEERREYAKSYQKKRLAEDPIFRLQHQIRCLIGGSLKRKGYKKNSRTEQILGCSISEFHKHIESLFKEGMSWDNRSEWEIDHITPVASANTEEELLKLNHFTNLQPLWTYENRAKGSTLL